MSPRPRRATRDSDNDGSGIDETVENGKTGYLISPKNVAETLEVLRTLLLDSTKIKLMSKTAQNYISQKATTDICMKKIEEFYQSVISKKESITTKGSLVLGLHVWGTT